MIKRFKFSMVLALLIMYLSLKNSNDFNKIQFLNIPHFDKFAHFCMYFGLMSTIILESWKASVQKISIFVMALFPLFYGILMEILQATLTTTRSASLFDVLFNTIGILISILLWLRIPFILKEKLRSK